MDMRTLMKALIYACGSYPKPGAPHRLSPEDDFERCVITGLSSSEVLRDLLHNLDSVERGVIAIGDIGLGKAMAKCVEEASRELGHRFIVEIAMAMPMATILAWAERKGEGTNFVKRVLTLAPPEDAKHLVEVLRSLGGEYAFDLERADLSERRVIVEGLSLDDVLEALSRFSKRYLYIRNVDVHGMCAKVSKYIDAGRNLSEALAASYAELLEREGVKGVMELFERRSLVELLKMDSDMRRKGEKYYYLMPPVLYVSTLMVLKGF